MSKSIVVLVALCALLAPAAASAADTPVAPDLAAGRMTALDGTVVWVSGPYKKQTLMQHDASGTAPVKGALVNSSYQSLDLGRDAANHLVLTYLRCGASGCTAMRDDLQGHRASIKGLALTHCSLTTAPALWRTRVAYGLSCYTGSGKTKRDDPKRSGLYVKTGSGAPRRLPRPKDAAKFGIDSVSWADLRGTQVAAVLSDIYQYAFTETTGGSHLYSNMVAASEGDSDEHVQGLSLAPSGAVWTLTNAEHVGDPNVAIIFRAVGDCLDSQSLTNPSGPDEESDYLATAMAVDGSTVYLVVPGQGVVSHVFAPDRTCG